MRLFVAGALALVACTHASQQPDARQRGADQRIEVLFPVSPRTAMQHVEAAARDLGLPGGRVSGSTRRLDFTMYPYRLKEDHGIEVALRAAAIAADPTGTSSRVVVSGTERFTQEEGRTRVTRPITRPRAGEESASWDELERFAAAIRTRR
jgi:hypothetical protein